MPLGKSDLTLFRLTADPGLPPLLLTSTGTSDLEQPSVLIGCGLDRGTTITGQGWLWGTVRERRWGTNLTLNFIEEGGPDDDFGALLVTAFDLAGGDDEAQPTHGDSGGGLFQKHLENWTLAGVMVGVDSAGAFYDQDAAEPGLQPDQGYHERIQLVRTRILEQTGLPDAGSALESWRWWHFQQLAATDAAADTADPDHDGVSNLWEFAFGLDPRSADAHRLPQPAVVGDFLKLEFVEPEFVSGIRFTAEESADLEHWIPLAERGEGIQHRVEIRIHDATSAFVRWKVEPTGSTHVPTPTP
jgi:hypothetical protein